MSALGGATAVLSREALRAARLARLAGYQAPAASPAAPQAAPQEGNTRAGGFASLPEGAFLRIIAQVDIHSGFALAAAGGIARESTNAGLAALRRQMEEARQAHAAETAAIEAERAATRQRHAAEQTALNRALDALNPLRQNQNPVLNRHGGQFAAIFQQLEAGPEGVQEAEAAFVARTVAAAAALQAAEVSARARIAEGELRSAVA
eukprot:TRINITY_DN4712_c0_g1_i3.p1 TRINITY_DN4712_c0_g1~~TRINITY_DN4712_c0_g1_i3.p1  ORF type:complete len:241 (+),score=38.02 TRINITY_DN4712_c0_g1_i3:104-724(+)